jgi:hypothetical protein
MRERLLLRWRVPRTGRIRARGRVLCTIVPQILPEAPILPAKGPDHGADDPIALTIRLAIDQGAAEVDETSEAYPPRKKRSGPLGFALISTWRPRPTALSWSPPGVHGGPAVSRAGHRSSRFTPAKPQIEYYHRNSRLWAGAPATCVRSPYGAPTEPLRSCYGAPTELLRSRRGVSTGPQPEHLATVTGGRCVYAARRPGETIVP